MSFGDFLGKLIGGGAIEGATNFFTERQKLRQQLELTKLQGEIAAEQSWAEWRKVNIAADESWEDASIKNSGWKDEYVLIVMSIPMVLVFIPWTAGYVMDGFAILEQTPAWYKGLLAMIFAATFGIRIWRRKAE